MEAEPVLNLNPQVRATFQLRDETNDIYATKGTVLFEKLMSFKVKSMEILKEFITKHNAPAEVPDEAPEGSDSDNDGEPAVKPPVKKRK